MLAPIIIGMAASMERIPPPVRPTIIDVVVDELCIRLVARIPVNKPRKGFEYEPMIFSAKSLPNRWNDVPISLILTRKK